MLSESRIILILLKTTMHLQGGLAVHRHPPPTARSFRPQHNGCSPVLVPCHVSASRSPPGLEALSVSSSAHFGVIFGVVFGSWGQYGGAAGSFFGADGDLARQRRLKRRLPQNKLTILEPSWEPKPTKNDQKSMPRCVQILHWFSDRFLIDFGP